VEPVCGTTIPESPHAKANPAKSIATKKKFECEIMIFMVPMETRNVHAGSSTEIDPRNPGYSVRMVRLVALLALVRREPLLAKVALILVCQSACSTTNVVGQPLTVDAVQQLKLEVLNGPVIVDYAGGAATRVSAESLPRREPAGGEQLRSAHSVLAGASLDWLTFGTAVDGYQRIPSSRVRRLRINDHGRGAINGLFYGLLGGVAAGGLLGATVASGDCTQTNNGYYTTTKCPSRASAAMGFGILGGLGGGLVGVLVGAAFGYRTTFVF
jgi:hypothetical protein